MKVAITGGTGFVGRHLARALTAAGHEVVTIARGIDRRDQGVLAMPNAHFVASDLSDAELLARAFRGCDAVAHCAGINREIGGQTYRRVHIEGTRNVVTAAQRAGVKKVLLLSFLRARPDCGSGYHESKWAAEELVRGSGLDYTIFKAGMIYGRGDHMLDHLSHTLHTFPLLLAVGFREKPIRPLPIADLIRCMTAALVEGRLSRQTVAIVGGEEMLLTDAVRHVARVLGRRTVILPAPIWFHRLLAQVFEWTMKIPLASKAQVRILSEGVTEAAPPASPLPADLMPTSMFTDERIRAGLPEPGSFGVHDLRCCPTQ